MKMLSQQCQLPYLNVCTLIQFISLIFIKCEWFRSMGMGAIKLAVGLHGCYWSYVGHPIKNETFSLAH